MNGRYRLTRVENYSLPFLPFLQDFGNGRERGKKGSKKTYNSTPYMTEGIKGTPEIPVSRCACGAPSVIRPHRDGVRHATPRPGPLGERREERDHYIIDQVYYFIHARPRSRPPGERKVQHTSTSTIFIYKLLQSITIPGMYCGALSKWMRKNTRSHHPVTAKPLVTLFFAFSLDRKSFRFLFSFLRINLSWHALYLCDGKRTAPRIRQFSVKRWINNGK